MTQQEAPAKEAFSSIARVEKFSAHPNGDELMIVRPETSYRACEVSAALSEELLPDPSRILLEHEQWFVEAVHGVLLPEGRIVNGCTPCDREGHVLYDLAYPSGRHFTVNTVRETPDRGKIATYTHDSFRRIHASAAQLFFGSASGDHHSHWLIQTAPKIQWYRDIGVEPDFYLVLDNLRQYQQDTLHALGITEDRILRVNPHEVLQFDKLYALYTPNPLSDDLRVFSEIASKVPDHADGPQRVYVSRQDARMLRRFLNEDRVIEIAQAHGFEVVLPSRLTFEEEVQKFRNARVIMGAVGAGEVTLERVNRAIQLIQPVRVVIPAAGEGRRFREHGYCLPKPLIPVHKRPMIDLVLENVRQLGDPIVLMQRDHIDAYQVDRLFSGLSPAPTLIPVDASTQGATCTVLLAQDQFNDGHELIVVNSDQYVNFDLCIFLDRMRAEGSDAGMLTFRAHDPKWSYAKLNAFGHVEHVAEKQVISDQATVGVYYFRQGSEFVRFANEMIAKNIRVKGEFYVSQVFNEYLQDRKRVRAFEIDAGRFFALGTPEDLAISLATLPSSDRIPPKGDADEVETGDHATTESCSIDLSPVGI